MHAVVGRGRQVERVAGEPEALASLEASGAAHLPARALAARQRIRQRQPLHPSAGIHARDLEQAGRQVGPAPRRVAIEAAVDQVLGQVDLLAARVDRGGLVLEDSPSRDARPLARGRRGRTPTRARPRPPRRRARCPTASLRPSSSGWCRRESGRRRAARRPSRSGSPTLPRRSSPSSRRARSRHSRRGRWPCRRRRDASGSRCPPRAARRAPRCASESPPGAAPRSRPAPRAGRSRDRGEAIPAEAEPNRSSQNTPPSAAAATPPRPSPMNSRRRTPQDCRGARGRR